MVRIAYAYGNEEAGKIGDYRLGQRLGRNERVIALVVDDSGELFDVITSRTGPNSARYTAVLGDRVIILDGQDASDFTADEFLILVRVHDAIAVHNDNLGIEDYIEA